MGELFLLFLFRLLFFILGIFASKRDKKLFADAVVTKAKVVNYYCYHDLDYMYSMELEYKTLDGTLIHTREPSGSNHMRHDIGTELNIYYSRQKPELFQVCSTIKEK
jgi:hypothetical protein